MWQDYDTKFQSNVIADLPSFLTQPGGRDRKEPLGPERAGRDPRRQRPRRLGQQGGRIRIAAARSNRRAPKAKGRAPARSEPRESKLTAKEEETVPLERHRHGARIHRHRGLVQHPRRQAADDEGPARQGRPDRLLDLQLHQLHPHAALPERLEQALRQGRPGDRRRPHARVPVRARSRQRRRSDQDRRDRIPGRPGQRNTAPGTPTETSTGPPSTSSTPRARSATPTSARANTARKKK